MKRNRSDKSASESPGGPQGERRGTLAFYGPNDALATKVVAAVFLPLKAEPEFLERWYSQANDARSDPAITAAITAFFRQHGVRHVVIGERIAGCPHEEGVDYPLGESCPLCPFWRRQPGQAGR